MERIRKENIVKTKLYLGPMSKNIVDAIIDYNNNNQSSVGIITSRRQIDHYGGYVNNWKSFNFNSYVKNRNSDIILCRDHAGPIQGQFEDDGMDSLLTDAIYYDVIHIDPFKYYNIPGAIDYTINAMRESYDIVKKSNKSIFFEVGTEQSIFHMEADDLYNFLNGLYKRDVELFEHIIYGVIQSGTSLKSGKNTGKYNEKRLKEMIEVCNHFGLQSKEHNGDYLSPIEIKNKFDVGLSAINIAPEIAHIETEYILSNLNDERKIDLWYQLCLNSGQYKKWFPKNINPENHKLDIVRICGHYVFTNPNFNDIFDLGLASEYVKIKIHQFINERI